ncbi:hypothetical protein [Erythrobacter sp. JK5]|uniref:hypothetical protein n=1 Tax=Erythrobacter sp. JK5 TaxID=2829500 RepID=UPI001BA98E51|nr:hypothetical protein [Erythrobacter sp. JK5]QUL38620.1 hypothetical protein KDC96_04310 [Erythrobacter sp. JK5]
MKKFATLACTGILVACQPSAPEEPVAEETVVEEPAVATVANGSPAGTYIATAADGSETTTVINADGTYSDTASDGTLIAEGNWAVADGKTCFTPTNEGATAMCFTESEPAEDGSFTATPDEGDPVTVRPAPPAI